MMRTKTQAYKAFILLLTLALLLAGCGAPTASVDGGGNTPSGAQQTPGAPTGGYIEKALDLSDYSTTTTLAADEAGSLWAAGKRKDTSQWELLNWADGSSEPTSVPLSIEGDATQVSISPDGSIAVLASKPIDMPELTGDGGPISVNGNAPGDAPSTDDPQQTPEGDAQSTPDADASQTPDSAQTPEPEPAQTPEATPEGSGAPQATPGPVSQGNMRGNAPGMSQPGDIVRFANESILYWVDKDGKTVKEQTISLNNDMLSSFAALDGYEIIVSSGRQGISRYDDQGKSTTTYYDGYASSFAVHGDKLYVLDGQSRSLRIYEIDTGEEVKTLPDAVEGGNSALLAVASDGTVYLVSSSGIWKVDQQAEGITKVLDGVNYSMNDPSNSLIGACVGKDGTIFTSMSSGEGMMGGGGVRVASASVGGGMSFNVGGGGNGETLIYAYQWSPDLDLSNMKELRITGLSDSRQLRKAISEFQRARPDVRVSLTTYLDAYDAETPASDYIRTINTELLAGNGADVLILDNLPSESYIAKGILRDLTEALADIDILPGIRQGSVARDGKLYGLPTTFSFNTIWGHKDTIDAIANLGDIAALAGSLQGDQTALAPQTAEELLTLFFEANRSQFTDENGNLRFDTLEFEQFLEYLYALYVEPDQDTDTNNPFVRGTGGGRMGMDMNQLMQMANQTIDLLSLNLSGVSQVNTAYSVSGAEDSAWMGIPSLSGDSYSYTPSLVAGVNAQSPNADIAIEFIRTLYSDAVQQMAGSSGIPTTRKAVDKLIEDTKNSETFMSIMIPNGPAITFESANDATWDALRAYCDQVINPTSADDTLMSFMVEETAKFFEGSKSARDTAASLQQRVAAYLAE